MRQMTADSKSVRQWIIEAYGRGKTTAEIAAVFGRCPSGVRRVRQQARQRGDALPRFHLRGSRGKFTPECREALAQWIARKPDLTLAQLQKQLSEQLEINVWLSTVDRWTKKLGLSFKKSLCMPLSRTGRTSKQNASAGMKI